jgi:hypothetical protein
VADNIQAGFFDPTGNVGAGGGGGQVEFGKTPQTVLSSFHPHGFNSASINVLLGDGSARAVSTVVNGTFTPPGTIKPVGNGAGGAPTTATNSPATVTIWMWGCSALGGNGNCPTPSGW